MSVNDTTGPDAGARCPMSNPSVGTLALAWPTLDVGCDGPDHAHARPIGPGVPVLPRAVITGTAHHDGAPVAYCLYCAAGRYDDFTPDDPTMVVPTLSELFQAQDLSRWRAGNRRDLTETETRFETTVGLPRPTATVTTHHDDDTATTKTYPAPWINGWHSAGGDFYSFRDDCLRAYEDQLCCLCGNPLGTSIAIAAADGKQHTSGGWGHPRCVLLAVATCPHFTRAPFETVAYRWDGAGVGVDRPEFEDRDPITAGAQPLTPTQLRAWAHTDPWGTTHPAPAEPDSDTADTTGTGTGTAAGRAHLSPSTRGGECAPARTRHHGR